MADHLRLCVCMNIYKKKKSNLFFYYFELNGDMQTMKTSFITLSKTLIEARSLATMHSIVRRADRSWDLCAQCH
jgi:hypothetical protein